MVKNWHYGKIVLLWAWGAAISFFSFNFLQSTESFVLGFPLILLIAGIPIILSIITWKWLGRKENARDKKD